MNIWAPRRSSAPAGKSNTVPPQISIGDPRFPSWLGIESMAGVPVTDYTALSVSAFWRGSLQIANSIGGLPLVTLRAWGGTTSTLDTSWLNDPAAPVGINPFNWKQTSILHMICGGDSFQRHLYNGLGMIAGLEPINPNAVQVYWDETRPGGKRFEVTLTKGGKICRETHDPSTMTQVMGPSLDGLRGLSVVGVARTSLGGAIAADYAAANNFRNGPMIAGIAVPTGEVEDGDAEKIQMIINDRIGGSENAGKITVLERGYDLRQWGMNLKDAQFLESRQFSIQEIARWLGVHPVFLMDPGAVSTWGTGVEILQRGLGRFTLPAWTDPFQEAMTDLLPKQSWAEFDFSGLERGSPLDEINLIIAQINGGLLTINQALKKLNRPGIGPEGDVTRINGVPVNPTGGEQVNPTSGIPATGEGITVDALRALLTGEAR